MNPVKKRKVKKQVNQSQEFSEENQSVSDNIDFYYLFSFANELRQSIKNISKFALKINGIPHDNNWSASTSTLPDNFTLTKKEVSEMLGVDVRTITNYVSKGYLKPIKTPSGTLRFRQSDLARFLESKEEKTDK